MLSSKKHKSYIFFLGGIFIFLIFFVSLLTFNFAFLIFNSPALAQGLTSPDVAGTGFSTRSLAEIAVNIINIALGFVSIVALAVLIYGGYVWMTSGGIPQRIALAKRILLSAVIGLTIILLSWAIIQFIFNAMNGNNNNNNNVIVNPLPPPQSSYTFKVIDYAPKGIDVPICRAIQATFDREYDKTSFSDNLHLMKYCINNTQCNLIELGDCNRVIAGLSGTFCANDIVGAFDYTDLRTVGFKPTNELEKSADYKVLIDGGIAGVQSGSGADCNGVNDICKHWDFKTGELSDNIPPKVLKVSPQNGADNVCLVKSIAAQFSEEMYKPSLTNVAAFSTAPIHEFSPSAPTFDILRESPKTSYTINTDYYPLLNANVIMDACWNKLSGNGDDIAEGSPVDDYGDPLPDDANPDWQFKTGETAQCVPKIANVAPNPSFYDAPNNTLAITGENFDDIADTISFSQNLSVTSGTLACFNALFTQTDQICLTGWDGVSIPNAITVTTPAGELDSNGAISGPLKVQVGQFQCVGQKTCKDGTNKGLSCNADLDCQGSLCGDSGSCDGGSNMGNGCDSDLECPGAVSNTVDLTVKSPHINSISPTSGPPGTWITVSGSQFGTTAGTVRVKNPSTGVWSNVALPCANSWNDNYIIIEVPTDFPVADFVNIQVIDSTIRHSNLNGDFALNNAPLGPGICAINPACGPTGISVIINGKRFGTAGYVLFGAAVAATSDWSDAQITAASPTQPTDGTYPVEVTAGGEPSNTLPFSTICSGRPKVVESLTCNNTTQSPSPYKNITGNSDADNDACINTSAISARFNMDMDEANLVNANIKLYKCTGYQTNCSSEITPASIDILNLDTGSEGFKFNLPGGEPIQNIWYQGFISAVVESELGTAMGTDYRWDFHIADSAADCPVDSVSINPANKTVNVDATVNYTAVPQAANCNFLNMCSGYAWTDGDYSTLNSLPADSCNESVSADTATPIGMPDTISAQVQSVLGTAQLTITSGSAGTSAVCGNGGAPETGEQCDDGNTTNGDGCSALCTIEPSIISVKPAAGATNVCKNAAVEITFSTLMSGATLNANNIRLLDATPAPITGSISYKNIDSADADFLPDQTVAIFYPSAVLSDSASYTVEAVGGAGGVKSAKGVELLTSCGGGMIWNGTDRCASTFTTGTEICKIDKVTIILEKDFNPDPDPNLGIGYVPQKYSGPDLFTCAGKNDCPDDYADTTNENQHNATAEAKDATGLTLSGVAYSWTKSTDAPFTMLTPDVNATLVQADPKSGIGALTVKADGGLAGIMSASTNVTVAPCDNPWPPAPNLNITYPFQDNGANPTNFSLWYCRDAGEAGTADDLPALSIIKKDGVGELVKEFFFYDNANPNDALGLRVYSNNTSHWSAKNWYEKRAPNRQGAPSSTTVDGWQAVQAGRTIYVNAANHTSFAPPAMNIYLMSHSDKISANLKNILNQLKSNWKFAITEYDDGTDGTALNPAAPQNHLRKLQRDTKRLTDLYDAAVDLYEYKMGKGKYPLLPAGTYLNGHSVSTWPSWDGTLSQEVRAPMPHDPISQMSSLIGWWKLDEGSGNAAADDGPYGIDGAPKNFNDPYGWRIGSQCKFGNCMELDGIDDYIDTGNFSGLYSNKLTVAAWIKIKPNAGWYDIIAGGCGNFVFAIQDGALDIEDQCGNADNIGTDMKPLASNKKIDDAKWHFVSAVYDGLVMKLYIDGAFESSGPANGDFDTMGGNLYIGSTPNNNSEYFDGSIDEVRIWNTPLSDTEINNLYKSNVAKFGSSEDSGWDQTKNAFACIAGADYDTHIYHYTQETSGTQFSVYAALEYAGNDGSTWRQKSMNNPYNPCDGVGDSQCACYNYRQQEVIPTDLGLCGNAQWDSSLGEQCDGSVTTGLNGLEGRICSTSKCDGGSNNGVNCADDSECPGGSCEPDDPACDPITCAAFCPGGPVGKNVCGNGKIDSVQESCDCADLNNPATCIGAKGPMSKYYCWNGGTFGNDLDASAILNGEIDDVFSSNISCSETADCNFVCGSGGQWTPAEINNGFLEPWIEQCDGKRGYCSNSSNLCSQNSDCSGGNCIALGNGGYYCDGPSAVQCSNGVRSCSSGTLTSCIGGAVEWNACGGDDFSPAIGPYNYLQTDLWGWCFR